MARVIPSRLPKPVCAYSSKVLVRYLFSLLHKQHNIFSPLGAYK